MRLEDLTGEELALLFGVFLFEGMEDATVRRCLEDGRCTLEFFEKRRAIYTPTRFRRSLAILLSGGLGVRKKGLSISALSPGEVFGAAALFTDQVEYETTVTAQVDSRVVFLPQDLVGGTLAASPAAAESYIRYLAGRIHFLNRKLEGLLAPGAVEKLARYLQSGAEAHVYCSAVELAARLDVSRATLYRAFAELEAREAIQRRGKEIFVLDWGKLCSR